MQEKNNTAVENDEIGDVIVNARKHYEYSIKTGTVLIEEVDIRPSGGYETVIKEKHIANFFPLVTARVKVNDGDDTAHYARCALMFPNGDIRENVDIPLDGIKRLDWLSIDSRCVLNPDVSKANEHLANIVLLTYHDKKRNLPTEIATIVDRNRLYVVEGRESIISLRPSEFEKNLAKIVYKLFYDGKISLTAIRHELKIDPHTADEYMVALAKLKLVSLSGDKRKARKILLRNEREVTNEISELMQKCDYECYPVPLCWE